MEQKQITATYAEAVKAIKEAILESRYRAARLVAEQQDGAVMLLVPSQNCCNKNCLD